MLAERRIAVSCLYPSTKEFCRDYLIVGDNCWQKEYVTEEQILGVLTAVVRDELIAFGGFYIAFLDWLWYNDPN